MVKIVWTTPRTWLTGEVVSAGNLNAHIRDNLNYLYNIPRFKGRQSTSLILYNGGTRIDCNTQVYDTDSMFNPTSATATIRRAGVYSLGCCIRENNNTGVGGRECKIINDTQYRAVCHFFARPSNASSQARTHTAQSDTYCYLNDSIVYYFYQNSGASLGAAISNAAYPAIWAAWNGA